MNKKMRETRRTYDITLGHPMDLLRKRSVPQAIFCWLGDVEVMICPRKESVVGFGCLRVFDV